MTKKCIEGMNVKEKRLYEIFSGAELEMNRRDLLQAKKLISAWLKGEKIDPALVNYLAMLFHYMTVNYPMQIDEGEASQERA